jgi:hypothetical protein
LLFSNDSHSVWTSNDHYGTSQFYIQYSRSSENLVSQIFYILVFSLSFHFTTFTITSSRLTQDVEKSVTPRKKANEIFMFIIYWLVEVGTVFGEYTKNSNLPSNSGDKIYSTTIKKLLLQSAEKDYTKN